MRDVGKGSVSEKPFEINELEEKSHFSPPEPNQLTPNKNSQFEENANKNTISQDEQGSRKQQNISQQNGQIKNVSPNKKQIQMRIPGKLQNELVGCEETQNMNFRFTGYTFLMYLGIFLYVCDFFVLIIPGLREGQNIKRATEVVLEVLFVLVLLVMIVSYEKARRANPGYPIALNYLYKVQKTKSLLQLPQIQDLKNHTMALLIKKAQLKQALQKNPSEQNEQIYESFEYKFNVEETKWCEKCQNIKRPRVRHCSECNQCIQRMDHHCVWLSNCVGRNNHKFFMLFLFFLLVILTFFTVIGALQIIDKENSVGKYLQNRYGASCKIIYIIGQISAIALWLYYLFVFCQQLYLIFNNLTFVQSLTNILSQKKPWKKDSCCDNFREVLGSGCWICPTKLNSTSHVMFGQQQNNRNPSAELVEQVLGGNSHPLTHFESQHHLRNQRNQI